MKYFKKIFAGLMAPIDYILWNMVMVKKYGRISLKKAYRDNLNATENLKTYEFFGYAKDFEYKRFFIRKTKEFFTMHGKLLKK
jgi:hypothetical protein